MPQKHIGLGEVNLYSFQTSALGIDSKPETSPEWKQRYERKESIIIFTNI
jgi:hypothetical protein